MKLAFTVTMPDLTRLLADIGRQAAQAAGPRQPSKASRSTISVEARRVLAQDDGEADNGDQS